MVQAIGGQLTPYGELGLAAWRGRETEARSLIASTKHDILARGEGVGLTVNLWSSALLDNGLGRYQDAMQAATQAAEHRDEPIAARSWALVELVEAAAHCGHTDAGEDALRRLCAVTQACGTDWALGVEARSRALLSEPEEAEGAYREAIDRLARTRMRVDLARAQLVYGEWLRRRRRRTDAREQLRTAHEAFASMNIEAFAARAARELRATGATARKRSPRHPRRPHAPRAANRAPRQGRPLKPGDRHSTLRQPPHRRIPPAHGVHQARYPLAKPTRDRALR